MSNRYARIRSELARAEKADAATALTHLRAVLDDVGRLIDETLAEAVVDAELSLRAAAEKVGLTENAIGPRLATTAKLAGYAADGRVNAKGVMRARYDKETGLGPPPAPPPDAKPMQFKRRRPTK
ncbi:hypothetical protein A5765_18735 [Mycolicibacterium celeriflavum]|uniref:hypothetical protein n=1 Tax=Mycolicibacterium celeriflavum TaxID=1249101 RepID=UPI0007FE8C19|nr:hypothetical protein [Mycolicibacterium celeriflavum]OBG23520.1 hypothetical protein A5765_18735 [Mycolicibacterium celeriflavum]